MTRQRGWRRGFGLRPIKTSNIQLKVIAMKLTPMDQWVRDHASENPRSVCARLYPDVIDRVAHRMSQEIPNADDQQRLDWLVRFETTAPGNFKPVYRGDITKLTAIQRLEVANGKTDLVPPPLGRRK